ncbi:hypothetical protein F5Y15DRAFT_376658 [Xylariaceae sp. FL0016]|nr:hypothetical protein F5Y15DRAFT_376658 [Xylariaceae sp. FL0016]
MQITVVIAGLMATIVTATNLHYTVPENFKAVAANCTMPAEFSVTGFWTHRDFQDGSQNHTEFNYADSTTGISTLCERNTTSDHVGSNEDRFSCEDRNVNFIFNFDGYKPGLTILETTCPGSTPQWEATGSVTLLKLGLECNDTQLTTTCFANTRIQSNFTSLEPSEPQLSARRLRPWMLH